MVRWIALAVWVSTTLATACARTTPPIAVVYPADRGMCTCEVQRCSSRPWSCLVLMAHESCTDVEAQLCLASKFGGS